MRVVVLTNEDFRTADSGGRQREYHLFYALGRRSDLVVYCFEQRERSARAPRPFPHPVYISRLPSRLRAAVRSQLEREMFYAKWYDLSRHRAHVAAAVRSADVVVASILYAAGFAARVLACLPPGRRPLFVWDTQNDDPSVWLQLQRVVPRGTRWLLAREARRAREAVHEVLTQADLVTCCSEADRAALISSGADPARTFTIPNGVDVAAWAPCHDAPGEPNVFAVFGSLVQPHTARGLRWFLSSVWRPFAAGTPRAELLIAGRKPPAWVLSHHGHHGITVLPDPIDMPDVIRRASVIAIPQLGGTGSKIKVLEALASGRPVVCSRPALIGLPQEVHRLVRLASSVSDWHRALAEATLLPSCREAVEWTRENADWPTLGAQFTNLVVSRWNSSP